MLSSSVSWGEFLLWKTHRGGYTLFWSHLQQELTVRKLETQSCCYLPLEPRSSYVCLMVPPLLGSLAPWGQFLLWMTWEHNHTLEIIPSRNWPSGSCRHMQTTALFLQQELCSELWDKDYNGFQFIEQREWLPLFFPMFLLGSWP